MESAEPQYGLLRSSERRNAFPHLSRGLVGESHRQDLVCASPSQRNQVRNARRQDASFADACPCENENRPLQRVHSAPLLFVQAIEIRWIGRLDATRERPRGTSVVP